MKFDLDRYISNLKWVSATEDEKSLVIGNLRGMYAVMCSSAVLCEACPLDNSRLPEPESGGFKELDLAEFEIRKIYGLALDNRERVIGHLNAARMAFRGDLEAAAATERAAEGAWMDAERYRWLRSGSASSWLGYGVVVGEALDRACDEGLRKII